MSISLIISTSVCIRTLHLFIIFFYEMTYQFDVYVFLYDDLTRINEKFMLPNVNTVVVLNFTPILSPEFCSPNSANLLVERYTMKIMTMFSLFNNLFAWVNWQGQVHTYTFLTHSIIIMI